jgi:hypothetical protein
MEKVRAMLSKTHQESKEDSPMQILFLKNNRSQSVEVKELQDIDLMIIKRRLERGESVFIARRSMQNNVQQASPKKTRKSPKQSKPLFFTHI